MGRITGLGSSARTLTRVAHAITSCSIASMAATALDVELSPTVGKAHGRSRHGTGDWTPTPIPCSIHFLEHMAQLVLLGVEIVLVVLVWRDLDRDPLDDSETVAIKPDHFLGVIGQEPNPPNSQVE